MYQHIKNVSNSKIQYKFFGALIHVVPFLLIFVQNRIRNINPFHSDRYNNWL